MSMPPPSRNSSLPPLSVVYTANSGSLPRAFSSALSAGPSKSLTPTRPRRLNPGISSLSNSSTSAEVGTFSSPIMNAPMSLLTSTASAGESEISLQPA